MEPNEHDAAALFIYAMLACCIILAMCFKDFLGFLVFEAYLRMR